MPLLSYSVDTIHGLRFNHGIPVRLDDMDLGGDGEVHSVRCES